MRQVGFPSLLHLAIGVSIYILSFLVLLVAKAALRHSIHLHLSVAAQQLPFILGLSILAASAGLFLGAGAAVANDAASVGFHLVLLGLLAATAGLVLRRWRAKKR